MKLYRSLLLLLLTFSLSSAKAYFSKHADICDGNKYVQCKNDYNAVRNLQIALSSDKKLGIKLKIDGEWGPKTKAALEKFQEHYGLSKADGWVGTQTKKMLDKVYVKVRFPEDVKFAKNCTAKNSRNYACYKEFKKNVNLKKSYAIFKDEKLLRRANSKNTQLKVDISEQRVRLYVDGKVALCSPCTTGAKRKFEPNTRIYRDKRTPKGIFRIKEKIADKRSTIFGEFYRNGKLVYKGDRRKYRGPKAKYVGASLKNWMRLTSSGIGLHASKYIKRYPGTNGCIRLPYKVSKTIFSRVTKGTPVSIVN